MTRCASERETPGEGLGWTPPAQLRIHIQTPRLLIRAYTLDDVPAVFDAVNASRDALIPWMPWAATDHRELAGSAQYISSQIVAASDPQKLAGEGALKGVGVGIFEPDGAFVGATGFHDLRPSTASAETGYWIRADRHGRGYCTEAIGHWLSWLLAAQAAGGMGLQRMRIYCSSENRASQRIPQKLGLKQEVHQRADYHVPGVGVTDRLGWGVLAGEWDCGKHRIRAERE